MESLAKLNFWKSLKYYSAIGKIVGMQSFLKKDFIFLNRLSWIVIFLIIFFYFELTYTIYMVSENFHLIMHAMFPLGIGVQVS